MTQRVIPLFPLNVVLFPGMILPLHIFEPRYRVMIQRCLKGGQLFGVVLIKEGQEVGSPAVPCSTGTLAAIQQVEHHQDGRMDLVTLGVSRFRLLEEVEGEPYQQGLIELIEEPIESGEMRVMSEVRGLFEAYLQAVSELANLPDGAPEEVPDPLQMSFHIAAMMPIGLEEKQWLLEFSSAGERLEAEVSILKRETELIQAFKSQTQDLGYFYYRGKRLSMN